MVVFRYVVKNLFLLGFEVDTMKLSNRAFMTSEITSTTVANFFLKKGQAEKVDISVMKINKLVYIAYGWNAGLGGGELFVDDEIRAWPYGPVIPSLYHEFKSFGNNPIKEFAKSYNPFEDSDPKEPFHETDSSKNNLLETIWTLYSRYSATDLMRLTHQDKTPWSITFQRGKDKKIPHDLIEQYYRTFLEGLLEDGQDRDTGRRSKEQSILQ